MSGRHPDVRWWKERSGYNSLNILRPRGCIVTTKFSDLTAKQLFAGLTKVFAQHNVLVTNPPWDWGKFKADDKTFEKKVKKIDRKYGF